jgi:hypothetical protein
MKKKPQIHPTTCPAIINKKKTRSFIIDENLKKFNKKIVGTYPHTPPQGSTNIESFKETYKGSVITAL